MSDIVFYGVFGAMCLYLLGRMIYIVHETRKANKDEHTDRSNSPGG